ncbi:hypothetical protein BGX24_000965 [Mortierella sp. AD032]|nr:hypothetical protein BGX24_000965 [Mortierella sp. AD032]
MTNIKPFRATTWATTFTLLSIALLSYCSLLSSSSGTVSAAPAKHTPAPADLVTAMQLTFSDTSPLPLQLQIESMVKGTQKLAYLPDKGPGLDFYYLNYRPTYIAGQSTIDFWMISPKGIQAPKTASLELLDEFGKIKLATLVKEGTEVPQGIAGKGEPFLWKSWVIPKELQSDFEFSEKFRIVLKTSDSATLPIPAVKNIGGGGGGGGGKRGTKTMGMKVVKNDKRSSPGSSMTSLVLNKIFKRAAAPAKKTAKVKAAGGFVVVQDRQFRIKGLKATPGANANANANAKVKTANPPASNNNKDATATPVIPQVEGKKASAGISSLSSINLLVTLSVAVLLSILGMFF